MKKLIIIIVLIVVVIGAYMWKTKKDNSIPDDSAAKIDINAVCEGALAYMTFPDAASAELFVQECKEGKRPEVIERYKSDMGLGAGAEI